eukprot:gene20906-40825_t
MRASEALQILASRFTLSPYEADNYESGSRRFEKIVRFATVDCVKAGWLVKDKGIWSITDEGRAAHAELTDPEAFYKRACKLYAEWKAAQPDAETSAATGASVAVSVEDVENTAKAVSVTFEESEEQAWEEKRRIRGLEEMRAQAGGVTVGATADSGGAERIVDDIQRAKALLDSGAISDSQDPGSGVRRARRLGALAASAALLAGHAVAGTPVAEKQVCPVGGERFTHQTTASYTTFGQRPDGKPYGSWVFPVTPPQCPKNGLVMYRAFAKAELARLPVLLADPVFVELRQTQTPYYRAAWLEHQLQPRSPATAWLLLN